MSKEQGKESRVWERGEKGVQREKGLGEERRENGRTRVRSHGA